MTHYNSLIEVESGWKWPVNSTIIEPLRPIVSNINQTKVYIYKSVINLPENLLWRRISETTLSIGNLLMHLKGTEHQWIGHFLGGKPLDRNKESEMVVNGGIDLEGLLVNLHNVENDSIEILLNFNTDDLSRLYTSKSLTAEFILHYTAQHLAYHAGQLVLIRKYFEPSFELFS